MDLIVVCGPTASGKTRFSLELAKNLNGEIICADSMQIYQYMDIGTAKPTLEEQEGVPHHLFGIVDPRENFSLADYATLAHMKIHDIQFRGRMPFLVGGTGLYIDTVVNNIKLSDASDPELRKRLEQLTESDLYEKLNVIDSKAAEKIMINDKRRLVRALEIYEITGNTPSQQKEISNSQGKIYDPQFFGITLPREQLYENINLRVDQMIERGLLDEVRTVYTRGMNKTAKQAIGYKEIIAHLNGECSLPEAIENIKTNTRRYAKRQLTWFRRNKDINWMQIDSEG